MYRSVGCARSKRQYFTAPQNQRSSRWMLGLRLDVLPALDLWDLVIEVPRTKPKLLKPTQASTRETGAQIQSTPNDQNVNLSNADQVSSNAHHSEKESQLYIFEYSEAVVKMIIIKERSPTMRNLSRTHRVALDWLFDRFKLEPKI